METRIYLESSAIRCHLMKRLPACFVFLVAVLFSTIGFAQDIERQVISSGGGTLENNEISLSVTLGEPFFQTQIGSEVILSQGMEQQIDLFTLSVIEIRDMDIKLYPNPTSSSLQVQSDQYITEMEIVDGFGKIIRTIPVNGHEKTVDVWELTAGIYFIQIKQENTSSITKFIKI